MWAGDNLLEEFFLLLMHVDEEEALVLLLVWHLLIKLVNHTLVVKFLLLTRLSCL